MLGERILPADDVLVTPDTVNLWLDGRDDGASRFKHCRMGRADDPDAVVDYAGHVHGLAA